MKNLQKFIDKNALLNNFEIIKNDNKNSLICSIIKANAYGHDMKEVIYALNEKTDYFAVFTFDEAIKARKYTTKPILTLGAIDCTRLKKIISKNIEIAVLCKNDIEKIIKKVKKTGQKCAIHLKVDTGMNRLGIKNFNEFKDILNIIENCENIVLKGIFTHIGSEQNATRQIDRFNIFTKQTSLNLLKHYASSNIAVSNKPMDNKSMLRIGIALYGYGKFKNLMPVMSVYAKIININHVKKGEFIGYGIKHKANKNMQTATLAVGYADGLMRCYNKKGFVLIDGQKCKIVADICMGMTIVDVSKVKNIRIGNFAVILGQSGNQRITAQDIAKKSGTSEYEVLTNFSEISCTKRKPVT